MTTFYIYAVSIVLIIGMSVFVWNKPTCQTGYIPSAMFGSGWTCVPGYKP